MSTAHAFRRAGAHLAPYGMVGGATHVAEHTAFRYRRMWAFLVMGAVEPLLYLFGVGIGVGALVGSISVAGHDVSYRVFVAPGLMATAAMNGVLFETTFGLFFQIKITKVFQSMLATPMTVASIVLGVIGWSVVRGGLYSVVFFVVMLALGLVHSPLAILMVPAALLTAFAFAAVGCAATTFVRGWTDLEVVQLAIMPVTLFSATFFPISMYPEALQAIVQLSPLYHAIALMRSLALGQPSWGIVPDLAYLVALTGVCLWLATRRLSRRLRP